MNRQLQSKLTAYAQQNKIFSIMAIADSVISKFQTLTVFIYGLCKNGKSTLYNLMNGVPLIGTRRGLNVVYEEKINQQGNAPTAPGIISTTLIPNFQEKNDPNSGERVTLCDLPGTDDRRSSASVLTVSYSIMRALETSEKSKFILVISSQFLDTSIQSLFKVIIGFAKTFHYQELSKQSRKALLNSTTLFINRSNSEHDIEAYSEAILYVLSQIGQFHQIKNHSETITEILSHFNQNKNIYLLPKAVANKQAPECTIWNVNVAKCPFFDLKAERETFREANHKSMIYSSFVEDFNKLISEEKQIFNEKISQRKQSFQKFVNIIRQFLHYVLQSELKEKQTPYKFKGDRMFNGNLNFALLFKTMSGFTDSYNVYEPDFIEEVFFDETRLRNKFNSNDLPIKLETGIKMANKVFNLYKQFQETPTYSEQDKDVHKQFSEYLQKLKTHIIKIIELFRQVFCCSYQEETILFNFLFIAVRGCRQMQVIYQLTEENRTQLCTNLNEKFKNVFGNQSNLDQIKTHFVNYLSSDENDLTQLIDKKDFSIFQRFIKDFKLLTLQNDSIARHLNGPSFDKIYQNVLDISVKYCTNNIQKLKSYLSILENEQRYIKNLIQKYNQDDQSDNQNEQNNQAAEKSYQQIQSHTFTYYHYLYIVARILLDMKRDGNIENDVFLFRKTFDYKDLTQTECKRILLDDQYKIAKRIFTYICDVDSTLEAYKKIIENMTEEINQEKLAWLEGFADYCRDNGRKEEAMKLYQNTLKYCFQSKNLIRYNQIRSKICNINKDYKDQECNFILRMKQKTNLSMFEDEKLKNIIEELHVKYVEPIVEKELIHGKSAAR